MLKLNPGGVENWNSCVITCMKHEEICENEPVDYFFVSMCMYHNNCQAITIGRFSRAINFVDYKTSTKFVSPRLTETPSCLSSHVL